MKKLFISALALFAAFSISAQDLSVVYNQAVTAFNGRDYATAAQGFETLIDQGMDSEDVDVQGWVSTAKSNLPRCYFMMGGMAAQQKDLDKALTNFIKSAELAELYGNFQQSVQSKGWVANIYRVKGGEAFNNKDYATAAEVFSKGYEYDPLNTEMALNLAMSYSELALANKDLELYRKGMEVYENIAALDNPKFAEDVAKAKEMIGIYTNNMVAVMQQAGNNDAVIAMADEMLAANPSNALAQKIRLQALFSKKDYAGVIASAEAAASAQQNEEDRTDMYFILGAAYNAQAKAPQAIEALGKVTAGSNVAAAKDTIAKLTANNKQ